MRAIDGEAFELDTSRCLASYTEEPGDYPSGIDPRWQDCGVGCLRCQTHCPENGPPPAAETERFTEVETELLLSGTVDDPGGLAPELRDRLDRAGLLSSLAMLPRNLRYCLEAQTGRGARAPTGGARTTLPSAPAPDRL